jgi:hypothetical protein
MGDGGYNLWLFVEDLEKIFSHFDKYPLYTHKIIKTSLFADKKEH